MPFNLLVLSCLSYVIFLFLVAFMAERRAAAGRTGWLLSPLVYTLSLSIYCTAWTFYGAVGSAASSGLEFMTIYLGPTLVFVGWWGLLRKLVRIGRQQRVTSIADLISSRYGKSNLLGVAVTVLAVLAATPYIALQLQSVVLSFGVFASEVREGTALWVAIGLALFTVLFGTRNLDADERHTGVVTAIAVEAVVKLAAALAVGVFVVWGIADGPADILARISAADRPEWALEPARWAGLTFASAAAVICLPRMFQVLVVENPDERHLATASWAFPLYLLGMSVFVMPIAVVGLEMMPEGNPDLFVLTIPLAGGRGDLAMLAFLGGFSSATSMVIVAAIALATMLSNHIVMPVWLGLMRVPMSGDIRRVVLLSRRLSIAGVLALGYGYFRLSGGGAALASIGLISFVGVAQVLPALIGGLFWRGATRVGAATGIGLGAAVWAWALLLPSLGVEWSWLDPRALLGSYDADPLLAALFWSMLLNVSGFCIGSLVSFPTPVERLQGAAFVNVFDADHGPSGWADAPTEPEELLVMAQRILGEEPALALFQSETRAQGRSGYLLDPTPAFLGRLERRLAGSVGAATAHAMILQAAGRTAVTVADLMAVADEAAQIMEYSARVDAQRQELTSTANALREANAKLTRLSDQKDTFLSQISHELRTPMTSIRAFSEILMQGDLPPEDARRHAGIVHAETIRLTRLLDDLLDLSVLESGAARLNPVLTPLREVLDRAIAASAHGRDLTIFRDSVAEGLFLRTDPDRLAQVFINLIANARKYCDAPDPQLRIVVRQKGGGVTVDFIDNGSGVPRRAQAQIFEKFARLDVGQGGVGLGLAICREVMASLDGTIVYLPGQKGAAFRVGLPLRMA